LLPDYHGRIRTGNENSTRGVRLRDGAVAAFTTSIDATMPGLLELRAMPVTLERIYRYPVKGLPGEALEAVPLVVGQGLPNDRRFAIARGDTRPAAGSPAWLPKQWFVMLMKDTALARLVPRIDWDARTIELGAPGASPCVARFDTAEGRRRIDDYVNQLLGTRREGPARWVESSEVSYTDVPQNCVSLVNLESVRELEARMACRIDPRRFRANFYLGGVAPWADFDWIGQEIRIGDAILRIPSRIPRCAATGVNPDSGARDVNVVKGLRAAYGHYDMGVYGEVLRAGRVAVGDVVVPPDGPRPHSSAGHWLRFFGFLARGAPNVFARR